MLAFFIFGLWAAIVRGSPDPDVDYMSVRGSMDTDYSTSEGTSTGKYFHESRFHYHYDGRFASQTIEESQRIPHLTMLAKTYLSTMKSVGAETWIMHGTLLGWWWNQKIMPWDTDLDVQISETTMHFLADHYNMTEYTFDLPDGEGERSFLLEINPNHVVRTNDFDNMIDGRWIDMSSGLFIDITSVRKDYEERKKGNEGALMCKDNHKYIEQEIFPLRDSLFEGVPVKIPYKYAKLLTDEYGEECLTEYIYEGHQFNFDIKEWVPILMDPEPPNEGEEPPNEGEEPPNEGEEPPKDEGKPHNGGEESPEDEGEPPNEDQPPHEQEQPNDEGDPHNEDQPPHEEEKPNDEGEPHNEDQPPHEEKGQPNDEGEPHNEDQPPHEQKGQPNDEGEPHNDDQPPHEEKEQPNDEGETHNEDQPPHEGKEQPNEGAQEDEKVEDHS